MDELSKATAAYRRAETATDKARADLRNAILAAIDAGLTQTEIARITGYTRETLRKIALSR